MISTSAPRSTDLAGVYVVLRPTPPSPHAISLSEWLPANLPTPFWVPLMPKQGVIKTMPVLNHVAYTEALIPLICQQLTQVQVVEWRGRHYEIVGVETESNDLFTIQLSISARRSLPPTLGRVFHALCLQWFANADPDLANVLHQAEISPFAIAIKSVNPRQIQLRISVLHKILLAPLLWGICADLGQEISITDIPCEVSSHVQIMASNQFEKLAQVVPQSEIELRLLTPTSFKQQQIIQTFPLPDCVFSGLLRRWNEFAPETLQFSEQTWQGMVAAYELKTQALKMRSDEIGAQGWVRYVFKDTEQAAIATTLANFAEFSGIGRKTTMGMGQTQFLRRKSQHE
jgi:CRISPR-associated endoribonuclease Cas6